MDIYEAATANFNEHISRITEELRDTKLLSKATMGDRTALDAFYLKNCFTVLYNRHRSYISMSDSDIHTDMTPESIVSAERVSYIEKRRHADHPSRLLKFTNLVNLYTERLR